MLAISERAVPAILLVFASVEVRCTSESFTPISTLLCCASLSVPLGPLTVTEPLATVHSTPLGSATGIFATRDMFSSPQLLRRQCRALHRRRLLRAPGLRSLC